jgi:hypothetical protein
MGRDPFDVPPGLSLKAVGAGPEEDNPHAVPAAAAPGIWNGEDIQAIVERSSRKRPSAMARSKSRLVAATRFPEEAGLADATLRGT